MKIVRYREAWSRTDMKINESFHRWNQIQRYSSRSHQYRSLVNCTRAEDWHVTPCVYGFREKKET